MGKLPLEGIRVVTISVVWAGPFAAQLLADWGAEVIRVESLHHFTFLTRGFPMIRPTREMIRARPTWVTAYPDWEPGEKPWNSYPIFQAHGRNKLSCTMDLRKPKGLDLFKKLAAKSDIVIQNNPTDTMEKLGITYEALREVKPDIILVAMPGYGSTGPYRNYRTLGSNLDEAAGHTWLRRYPDMDPSSASVILFSDASGGAHGAFAALAALRYKRRTGKGQFVDLSQVETIMPYLAEPILDHTMNGRVQDTLGNRHPYMAPHGCYRCKGEDRWVVIAVNSQEEWRALCEVMDRQDLETDERFADVLSRRRHLDELDAIIEEWTGRHDHVEVMHRLQEKGVAAGAVLDDRDAYNDPHLKARGFFPGTDPPGRGYPSISRAHVECFKNPQCHPNAARLPRGTQRICVQGNTGRIGRGIRAIGEGGACRHRTRPRRLLGGRTPCFFLKKWIPGRVLQNGPVQLYAAWLSVEHVRMIADCQWNLFDRMRMS